MTGSCLYFLFAELLFSSIFMFEVAIYFFNVLFSLAWPSLWISLGFCQLIHIPYVPFWRFFFFIGLCHFLLFLLVLCNFVLVLVLIRKQYPFPIYGLDPYRERSLPIRLNTYSKGLSNFSYECVSSYKSTQTSLLCRFLIKGIHCSFFKNSFFFQKGTCNLLPPLVSDFYATGPLKLRHGTNYFLVSASCRHLDYVRLYHVPKSIQTELYPQAAPGNLECWRHAPLFSFPLKI